MTKILVGMLAAVPAFHTALAQGAPSLQVNAASVQLYPKKVSAAGITFEPVTIRITSVGGSISFRVQPSPGITVSATGGATPALLTVSAFSTTTQASGSITISSPETSNGGVTIPVSGITPARLSATVTALAFRVPVPGQLPPPQSTLIRAVYSTSPNRAPLDIQADIALDRISFSGVKATLDAAVTPATLTLALDPASPVRSGGGLVNLRVPYLGVIQLTVVILVGPQPAATLLEPFRFDGSQSPPATHSFTLTGAEGASWSVLPSLPGWLSVSPSSGIFPATVSATVDPSVLTLGHYSSSVSSLSDGVRVVVPVVVDVGPPAAPIPILDSSLTATAPGSIATLTGINLALLSLQAPVPLPLSFQGVSLKVNGVLAPVFYVSPRQISFQVPFSTSPGKAAIELTNDAGSAQTTMTIGDAAPAYFYLYSPVTVPGIVNQNGVINYTGAPARSGEYVSLYMTGQGLLDGSLADGAAAQLSPLLHPALPVTASVGGIPATVLFAGLTPGSVGLFQVNLLVPDIYPGDHLLKLNVGAQAAEDVALTVGQ